MSFSKDISVVLPCYLEEENLRLLLPRVHQSLKGLDVKYEVLVVDTMTPLDATSQVCAENGVEYIPRNGSNYFGDAVRTGIAKARGEWILFMDADGSHPPEFIKSLWGSRALGEIIIASRYVEGGMSENSTALRIMSLVLNFTYSLVLNLKIKDVSNSYKLYKGDLLRGLSLKCNNFDIVEEILAKIIKKNPSVRMIEVPFSFKKRMFGETKRNLVVFIFTYIVTIVRLKLMIRE